MELVGEPAEQALKRHTVTVVPSGRTFEVAAEQPVLEAALAAGLHLPYACRGGSCGACRVSVREGAVRYREDLPPPAVDADLIGAGDALICVGRTDADLVIEAREVEQAAEVRVRRLPARIERMERLAHDVMGLWLRLPAVERMQFLAGQYLDVISRTGLRRSFSIANPPHDDELIELHVRRIEDGRFTGQVFEELEERSLLRVEGPLGQFTLDEESQRPRLLIAGGTGYAPMRSMVEHALAAGDDTPTFLYWGARSRCDLYRDDEARSWDAAQDGFCYLPVLSEPDGDWDGRVGLVHRAVLADHADLSGFDVYAAGPPAMIAAIREDLPAQGMDLTRFRCDSFEFNHG